MEKLKTNELSLGLDQTFRNDLIDNFEKIQKGVDGQSDALNNQITDLLGDVAPQDQNEVTQARIDMHSNPYRTLKSRADATQATAETALSEERDTSAEVQDARTNSNSQTYPTLKARMDDQENDLNNSINDKLSQISSVPETFANLAALKSKYPTGKTGLFVTADNGHKYIWSNGTWTDAGVYQSAGIADRSITIDKLASMRINPEAFANEATLRAKYPQGNDQLNITTGNGHLWIWIDGVFKDCGQYPMAGLSDEAKQQIGNLMGIFPMDNFHIMGISNGPATEEIVNINNKNWLSISTSKGTYNGLRVEVQNPNLTLGQNYPIHFETRLWNANGDLAFNVSLVGTRKDNTAFEQQIKTLQVNANKITQLTADFQIASELHDSSDLSIHIKCKNDIALQDFKFANFVLKYDNVVGDTNENNLLLRNQISGLPIVQDHGHNSQTVSLHDQQWLQIKNVEPQPYSGFNFNSVMINPYSTFYFETDVLSNDQTKINVYAMGLDDLGTEIWDDAYAILIKKITVNPNAINHIACNFRLPTDFQSAKYVNIRIQQPENKPLNLMITNAHLSYDNPTSCADNLIPKGNMSQSFLPQTLALASHYTFSTYYMNGEEWTWLEMPNSAAWQGIGWDVDSNYDPSMELEFSIDVATDIERDLQLSVVPYDAQGSAIGNQVQVLGKIHLSGNKEAYHISKQFKLDDRFKNYELVNIRIQDLGNNALSLFVKNIRLWYVTDSAEKYGLPTVKIKGDLSGMTKDDAKKVTYEYRNGNTVLTGCAKLKWQGNSSAMWDKKGYRLQPFTDNTFTEKEKVQFIPSWSPTSKINLKAYYTDGLLSRDVVNANIGADIASTNLSLPNDLKQEDNFGFINGFPIVLIFNGEFEGIYSFNTARSDFSYTKYGIMGNDYSNVTNFTSANKTDVKLDGSDFESLNPETVTDDEKSTVGDLVTWVATSTDENFKADFEKHLDLKTTTDYFILCNLLASVDSFGKNQIFLTWDGVKWFMQAYDLDTTFGISWEGKKQDLPTGLIGTENNLFNRLSKLFASEISARYAELRTWLTPAYVLDKYKKRINAIGVGNYQQEFAKWNNPSKDIATYSQLKNAVLNQFSLLDKIWLNK